MKKTKRVKVTFKDCQVELKDIFSRTKDGRLYLGDNEMTENEIKNIKEEIKFLEKTKIWQIYINTLREASRKRIFEQAESFDDVMSGKMLLLNQKLMLEINTYIKSWIPRVQPKIPKNLPPIQH